MVYHYDMILILQDSQYIQCLQHYVRAELQQYDIHIIAILASSHQPLPIDGGD